MKRKALATRRETLLMLGATGAMLVGCGSDDGGSDGSAGSASGGTRTGGGTAGKGGSGTGGSKAGTGGTGAASTGGTSNGSGGSNAGTGGSTAEGGAGISSGSGGGDAGSGGTAPVDCKAKVETTVGPFPNINPLERRDVRGNTSGATAAKPGAALTLRLRVYDLDNSCKPIEGAVVDIWQCDAAGDYASYSAFGTAGQDFLRGYQKTNAQGVAEFLTIFPGSYSGRAIHIHFSIQSAATNLRVNDHGDDQGDIFVAQIYFAQKDIEEIFAAFDVYQQGAALTSNDADGIFRAEGGKDLIVRMSKNGAGYIGEVDIGVRRADIGM